MRKKALGILSIALILALFGTPVLAQAGRGRDFSVQTIVSPRDPASGLPTGIISPRDPVSGGHGG